MKQNRQYMKGLAMLMCGTILCGSTMAQEPKAEMKVRNYDIDFDYVYRQNGWLGSNNGAGLRLSHVDVSYAEAYFTKQDGKFMNYHESDDSFNFGAKTESFRNFDKISFYGKMQYEYFQGNNMKGSIFTRPGENPFDIVEFTPGKKIKERYIVSAGAGFDIACNLLGGIKIDYQAENYAKRKDLRHKNRLMDFNLTAGLVYQIGSITNVGLNYIYTKRSERIEAEQVSEKGEVYEAFFNKGLWFGESGLWNNPSLRLYNSSYNGMKGLPIMNIENGASLQLNLGREARGVNFFGELTYKRRSGETGDKGVKFTEHTSDIYQAHGMLRIPQSNNMHFLRGAVSYEDLQNQEYLLEKQTINGVATIISYGSSQIFAERTLSASAEYEFAMKATTYYPVFSLRAGAQYSNRSGVSSLVYPEFKTQWVQTYSAYVNADKNFTIGKGVINANLGVSFAQGRGNRLSEHQATLPEGMLPSPYSSHNKEYVAYEFEYLTAPRYGLSVGAGYTHHVGRARLPLYCHLKWDYTRANKLVYILDDMRSLLSVRIGCKF